MLEMSFKCCAVIGLTSLFQDLIVENRERIRLIKLETIHKGSHVRIIIHFDIFNHFAVNGNLLLLDDFLNILFVSESIVKGTSKR